MTKPSTKADKPARERAAKGDTSNEGAQAERDSLRACVKRMRLAATRQRNLAISRQDAHGETTWGGYIGACHAMDNFLDGRTARFAARPGGLKSPRRGPGKGARRAQ